MKNVALIRKATTLLEHIYSSKSFAKKLCPLKNQLENGEIVEYTSPQEQFYSFEWFPFVYDDCKSKIIEIAVLTRQLCEKYEFYGQSVNNHIKYTSIGCYPNNNNSISFTDSLSKIIHSTGLEFELCSPKNQVGYGFSIGEQGFFTGKAIIEGYEKDNISKYSVIIDIEKICINAIVLSSII